MGQVAGRRKGGSADARFQISSRVARYLRRVENI